MEIITHYNHTFGIAFKFLLLVNTPSVYDTFCMIFLFLAAYNICVQLYNSFETWTLFRQVTLNIINKIQLDILRSTHHELYERQ